MRAIPAQFLGTLPETTQTRFRGPNTTLDAMVQVSQGPQGEKSTLVRQFVEWFVRDVQPKDYLGEIIAIRNIFVQPSPFRPGPLFRYTNDPRHVEMVKTPERCVREIKAYGSVLLDCDEAASCAATFALVLGREAEFVAIGFAPKSLSHVGVRIKEPKSNRWIWVDSVAGPREREAAQRAQTIVLRSVRSLD